MLHSNTPFTMGKKQRTRKHGIHMHNSYKQSSTHWFPHQTTHQPPHPPPAPHHPTHKPQPILSPGNPTHQSTRCGEGGDPLQAALKPIWLSRTYSSLTARLRRLASKLLPIHNHLTVSTHFLPHLDIDSLLTHLNTHLEHHYTLHPFLTQPQPEPIPPNMTTLVPPLPQQHIYNPAFYKILMMHYVDGQGGPILQHWTSH